MALRWPGYYIPPIPNKTLVGNTEKQVTANRTRFLNTFLQKIASVPQIYYGEEFQAFLKVPQESVEKSLEGFKELSYDDLLDKYRTCFPEVVKESLEQVDIDNFFDMAAVLRDKKMDLNNYKMNLRRMAESRDKFKLKEHMVFERLLPEFEETCYEWWDNQNVHKCEPHEKFFTSEAYKAKTEELKLAISESNPFWMFFDIVKFELREIDVSFVNI